MRKFSIISLIIFTLFTFGCRTKNTDNTNPETMNSSSTSPMQFQPNKGDTIATLDTSFGEIKILLYTSQAPETSKNFIELTNQGKYDGTIFHRVINDFMIQGGDFENKNGTGGYSYKGPGTALDDEFGKGLSHIKGAVSMANAGPNTGGSQFFIVQNRNGTPFLDGKHSIFGYVYKGIEIVDEIAATETDQSDKPLKDVIIKKIDISQFE